MPSSADLSMLNAILEGTNVSVSEGSTGHRVVPSEITLYSYIYMYTSISLATHSHAVLDGT